MADAGPPVAITSLRRRLLLWLIMATMVIGALALIDTRTEAIRTSQQVSDRVLVGSAMAIARGVSVDATGGLAVNIPFSAPDMFRSTAQDQVFYRIDGLIAVAALAAWAATTPALCPLNRMSTRISARAPQELLPVLGALNGFLARPQMAMSALANFSSNANHQIRTPLTVARVQIGLAQKNAVAAPVAQAQAQAQALARADAALVRTERVLEQLLLLARIESSSLRPEMLPCDVAAIARAIAEDELPRALQLGQDQGFDGPAMAMVVSEEVLLGELLRNLVSNALLHCPLGSAVTLTVRAAAGITTVIVTDTGPAVPQAVFDHLQNRLTAQAGDGQVRAGQHGLGLHIVREIVGEIGASVTLSRNVPGTGLRIAVALPSAH